MSDEQQNLEKDERLRLARELEPELEATRKAARERKRKSRELKKQRERAADPEKAPQTIESLSVKETTDIFKTHWGISNRNVIEQCIAYGQERAHELGVVPNHSYWRDGGDLEYRIDVISGLSEVLSMRELYTLWKFTAAGLKILGEEVSFESWLLLRDRCRKDLYWLASVVLQIPLVEEVHRSITEDFYPHLNADGMFKLDYTLTDMHAAIARQVETREYLLLDPRAWMKTALASAFVLQFLLNFPEGRVYDVSGTDDLALGFLRIMKGYLGHESGVPISTLHLLFPEYTLRGSEATSEQPVLLPCRKFYQKDFSFETFGVMAAASGRHCDLYLADDIVQEPGSENTREKLRNKADTLSLNIPDAHAVKLGLGTRYHLEDYYSHKIALLDEDPMAMKFMCRGVFTTKAEFERIPIQDRTLDQVELLWPLQYGSPEKTFAAFKRQMKVNLNDFLHQKMNSPVSTEDLENKIAFDYDRISNCIVDFEQLSKEGDRFLIVDVAFSTDNRADFSCLLVGRVAPAMDSSDLPVAMIEYLDAQRRRSSELAVAIVEVSLKFNLKSIIVERVNGAEAIIDEVRRQASLRGHVLPYVWAAPVIATSKAKWTRIKMVELLFAQSRIWISSTISQTAKALMLDQFCKYTGKRSSTRKDDIPDTFGLFCTHCLPKNEADAKTKQEREQAEEQEAARIKMMEQYQATFEGRFYKNVSTGRDWHYGIPQTETPSDDTYQESDFIGAFGIPCAPRFAGQAFAPKKATVSFADTIRKKNN